MVASDRPPSMTIVCPLIAELRGEQRNAIDSAINAVNETAESATSTVTEAAQSAASAFTRSQWRQDSEQRGNELGTILQPQTYPVARFDAKPFAQFARNQQRLFPQFGVGKLPVTPI